ncbi:MAG: response regulator [Candidatus Thermoplasmatota archaeon]|nr:response regulator [Candidatus Thermoplasmatota archaeon]
MNGKEGSGEDKVYEILVVDDETEVLKLLQETLRTVKTIDCNVTLASNGEYGLKHVKEGDFDIVLSDYQMPQMNGIEFLKEVKKESPDTVRFMITGQGDLKVAKEAINEADIEQYIEKPWDTDELILTIRKALGEKEEDIEGEEEVVSSNEDVKEAVETVEAFQKNLMEKPSETFEKETMMFEFESSDEFNEFSFQIKNKKNLSIEDVNIFENKYVVTVGVYPPSYGKVK